jgi:microsomal dipeptidase-like Zn-dependent dipeptidase
MSSRRPFIDLHAHFPMHSPFPPMPFANPDDNWKQGLFHTARALLNDEFFAPRVSLDHLFCDDPNFGVSGFGSVLYDPEDELLVASGPTPIPEAIQHICAQWQHVEDEVSRDGRLKIARNPQQVGEYLETGEKFLFHTLEGGFSLGGDPFNVRMLASLGVAAIVPAHLLFRGVSTCENAFPPAAEILFRDELEHQPACGLTPLGERIVEECFRQGVIVDITHAREDAQNQMFDIARGYPRRPVISSHNSVRRIHDAGLNLSDDAILQIKESTGVVGVIFYKHWLRRPGLDLRRDLQLITDVIDHVRHVTQSDDFVAIGSDLDGFIDSIQTCSNYSRMSNLSCHLVDRYGVNTAEKILCRNALRVLQDGWKGVKDVPAKRPC